MSQRAKRPCRRPLLWLLLLAGSLLTTLAMASMPGHCACAAPCAAQAAGENKHISLLLCLSSLERAPKTKLSAGERDGISPSASPAGTSSGGVRDMSTVWFSRLKAVLATFAVGFSISGCGGGDVEEIPSVQTFTEPTAVSLADPQTISATGGVAVGSTVHPALVSGVAGSGAPVTAPARRSGVGLNLGPWSYYQPDLPTLDLMKKASPWFTQCAASSPSCTEFTAGASAWDTKEQDKLDMDNQGWVRKLPLPTDTTVKYRSVATMVFSGGYQPPGRYVVLYEGRGTLTFNGAGTRIVGESRPGRDVVLMKNDSAAGFWLTISAINPADPLRDIQIYAPGGVCSNSPRQHVDDASACEAPAGSGTFIPYETLAQRQQLFYPAYLKDLTGFRTLRFMDWGRTNFSKVSSWKNRPQLTDRSWAGDNGVPIELAFQLAAAAKADPWINIPMLADDDYVRQFATLARTSLHSGDNLILEYANETWNLGFPVAKVLLERARTEWPQEVAKGTRDDQLSLNYYAKRSVQICQMVKTEFGNAASSVKCVVNTQAAVPNTTDTVLGCKIAQQDLGNACASHFDAVAIAPYFAHYLGDLKYRDEIKGWFANADMGVSRWFEEILGLSADGKATTPPLAKLSSGATLGAVAMAKSWVQSSKLVADKYKVPLWAYEGGQHITQLPYDKDPQFFPVMKAVNRDPRMAQAYDRMMQDWISAGGQTFVYFTHVDIAKTWGIFGLKESPADDAAPKWQAAMRQRDTVSCWWAGC